MDIVKFQDFKERIENCSKLFSEYENSLNLKEINLEIKKNKELMSKPNFWDDNSVAKEILKKNSRLEKIVSNYEHAKKAYEDCVVFFEIISEEKEDSLVNELEENLSSFEKKINERILETLLKD